jgi:hypothetical protein
MSKAILHQYPLSPYTERFALPWVSGLTWNSVEIPVLDTAPQAHDDEAIGERRSCRLGRVLLRHTAFFGPSKNGHLEHSIRKIRRGCKGSWLVD